ncbi:MAG: DUF3391 domain-containing protein, partial [Burkholderiales bacterium]|nr:DUF3391 domain-containing protein [Burkholderiales bacterium]
MGTPDTDAVPIDPSQLQPGLFVWLDMKWMDHPFLTNRFLVRKDADVAVIQSLGTEGRLYYVPAKSTAEPLPLGSGLPGTGETDETLQLQLALELERSRLAISRRERKRQDKDSADPAHPS